jgi:mannosyltransferase OCH1-like enzyme
MYNRKYINTYLKKRDDILIKNNYKILYKNEYNDIFDIVCYYISYNICKVIVRRTDTCEGWGQNLNVLIEDNNIYEEYSIGSSNNNIKIIEIYLKIQLFKTIYLEQKIPKVIIQTWDEAIYKNTSHYNDTMLLIEMNPEYEYKFFDNNDCINFIKNNFDKNIFDSYNSIISNKIKSELFRYCYLYINGGCYINSNLICKNPLHKIINQNDNNILCHDEINNVYYNGIIMTIPKNELINNMIQNIINNNINKITSYKLIKKKDKIFYNNELFFIKKKVNLIKNDNKLTFEKNILLDNFIFNFYPPYYNDEFKIYNIKDNIYCIERIDINSGWDQNIKLQITNFEENNVIFIKDIIIGNSDKNKKIFII